MEKQPNNPNPNDINPFAPYLASFNESYKEPNILQPEVLNAWLAGMTTNPPIFSSLLSQPIRTVKQNLYYRGQTIDIDGFSFENCRFDNCTLKTENGNFEFTQCIIDATTKVSYLGNALRVIQMYNRKEQGKVESLHPKNNTDGTVDIKGQ